jgi:short-subunit dehydrogenase
MPFIQLGPDRAEELINLQVLAAVRLAHAALSGMLTRGHGAIINVSSRLALSAPLGSSQLPKRAVYAGTKAFLNTFTQLLHSELEGTGVQVQALCPGLVETEFHERAGIDRSRYPASAVSKPEDVVDASLAGLKLGEVICIPTMQETALLDQIEEAEKRFFENTRSGQIAGRYTG